MTNEPENYIANFVGRYKDFKDVSGLVAKLSDKSKPGWSGAREAILRRQIVPGEALDAAITDADDIVLDGYAKAQIDDAKEIYISDFTRNKAEIVGEISSSDLEQLTLNFDPVEVQEVPFAQAHNAAAKLLKSYKEIESKNKGFGKEVPSLEYRDYIAKAVNGAVGYIHKIQGASDKAKKAFAAATIELAKKSERFARAAGNIIQKERFIEFGRYFAEQAEGAIYSLAEFTRNNILYGKDDKNAPILGDVILASAQQAR